MNFGHCPSCGAPYTDMHIFCEYCGTQVNYHPEVPRNPQSPPIHNEPPSPKKTSAPIATRVVNGWFRMFNPEFVQAESVERTKNS